MDASAANTSGTEQYATRSRSGRSGIHANFRASVTLASIGPGCHRWAYGSITDQGMG
jgi:hypothetical protein